MSTCSARKHSKQEGPKSKAQSPNQVGHLPIGDVPRNMMKYAAMQGMQRLEKNNPLFVMDFPKLQDGQYAVLKAKVLPGLFLGLGRQLDLAGGRWKIFNSLIAAHCYATDAVATQPSVECGIYNALEQHIHTVRI